MNEDGFRAYLLNRLSPRSASSYLSNARRVEAALQIDLHHAVSSFSLDALEQRLKRQAASFTEGSLADCLTALRTYSKFFIALAGGEPGAAKLAESDHTPVGIVKTTMADAPLPPSLQDASIRALLGLQGGIIEELRRRGVVRTGNSPLGDYAEYLFANAFGWRLENNSSSGCDAIHQGVRYQIKGRRISASSPSRQLGAIRRLPEMPFDVLAAVLFDEGYRVLKAILIPHALVEERARHVEHTNSWRLILDDRWWSISGTTDVTKDLKTVQEQGH